MNTQTPTTDTTRTAPTTLASSLGSSRRTYRSRETGTGYGKSSGYGLERRYTSDWAALRFRCG